MHILGCVLLDKKEKKQVFGRIPDWRFDIDIGEFSFKRLAISHIYGGDF